MPVFVSIINKNALNFPFASILKYLNYCISDINIGSVRAVAVGVMTLQVVSILMSCTLSKLWMTVSFVGLINTITCVLTVFEINVTYMTMVTSLLLGNCLIVY